MMMKERKAQAYAQALGLRYLKLKACIERVSSDSRERLVEAMEKVDNQLLKLGVAPEKPETWKVLGQEALYSLADTVWEINDNVEKVLEMERQASARFINFIEPKLDNIAGQTRATIRKTMNYLSRLSVGCI